MLQITLVIEDAKVSLDELQEEIGEIEDYVQSTDVAGEQYGALYGVKLTTGSYAKALDAEITSVGPLPHAYDDLVALAVNVRQQIRQV